MFGMKQRERALYDATIPTVLQPSTAFSLPSHASDTYALLEREESS